MKAIKKSNNNTQTSNSKGFFSPTITHEVDKDTLNTATETDKKLSKTASDTAKVIGSEVAKGIEKGTDKLANAIVTTGVAGAAAYAIKNAALPPATKFGLVLGASAAGSLIQTISTSESALSAL